MADNINFISETEVNEEELLERFLTDTIMPLVKEDNRQKEVFRSRFWGYLWSACFLLGANTLIILFRYLMYGYVINYEQLFLVCLLALAVVVWPLYQYHIISRQSLFDEFLKFYGNYWQQAEYNADLPSKAPIIPPHENYTTVHGIVGNYDSVQIFMYDMIFTKMQRIQKFKFKRMVSSGVMIKIKFSKSFNKRTYLFDESGFYRKNSYTGLENITENVHIPAANYFKIFAEDESYAKDLLPSMFFERVLDMKDTFRAKHLYIQIEDDFMLMYLENASLYFENSGLWHKSIDKEKYFMLHRKMQNTIDVVQIIQAMKEQI